MKWFISIATLVVPWYFNHSKERVLHFIVALLPRPFHIHRMAKPATGRCPIGLEEPPQNGLEARQTTGRWRMNPNYLLLSLSHFIMGRILIVCDRGRPYEQDELHRRRSNQHLQSFGDQHPSMESPYVGTYLYPRWYSLSNYHSHSGLCHPDPR